MSHTPYSMSDWLNYLTHDEIDLLIKFTHLLPAGGKVVNIGAGSGTSGLTFMLAREDIHLFTIDVSAHPNPYGGLDNERIAFEDAGLLPSNRYTPIHGESIKVGREWPHGPADFVFVDGDHSYAGAWGDIEVWWALLAPGGYMGIHDFEKVPAWQARNPHTAVTDELLAREIKPYYDVDRAVHDRLIGRETLAGRADALVVFQKGIE